MRVLLIEDEPTLAHSIELMLRSEKFDVVLAALGEDGISLAETGSHSCYSTSTSLTCRATTSCEAFADPRSQRPS